jgi:hypothetical protein
VLGEHGSEHRRDGPLFCLGQPGDGIELLFEPGGRAALAGDTLAGVALQLWGDASLWYKLAAANGLSASSSLSEGQALRLPSGVQRSSFTTGLAASNWAIAAITARLM